MDIKVQTNYSLSSVNDNQPQTNGFQAQDEGIFDPNTPVGSIEDSVEKSGGKGEQQETITPTSVESADTNTENPFITASADSDALKEMEAAEYKSNILTQVESYGFNSKTMSIIENLIYIDERGENQLDILGLCEFSASNKLNWDRVESLALLEHRGKEQLDSNSILKIINLPDWNKTQKLANVEHRDGQQFNADDIVLLSNQTDFFAKEWKKIETLMYVEGRGEQQFSAEDLAKLCKISDVFVDDWETAKKLAYLPARENNQLSADEIYTISTQYLSDGEIDNIISFIAVEGRGDNQFSYDKIRYLIGKNNDMDNNLSQLLYIPALGSEQLTIDDLTAVSKLRPALAENIVKRNLYEIDIYGEKSDFDTIKQIAEIADDSWSNINSRNLLSDEKYKDYNLKQIFQISQIPPINWINVEKRDLLSKENGTPETFNYKKLLELYKLSDEDYNYLSENNYLAMGMSQTNIIPVIEERNITELFPDNPEDWSKYANLPDDKWNIYTENIEWFENNLKNYQQISILKEHTNEEIMTIKDRALIERGISLVDINSYLSISDEQWQICEERFFIDALKPVNSDLNNNYLIDDKEIDSKIAKILTMAEIDENLWKKIEETSLHKSIMNGYFRFDNTDQIKNTLTLFNEKTDIIEQRNLASISFDYEHLVFLTELSDENWNKIREFSSSFRNDSEKAAYFIDCSEEEINKINELNLNHFEIDKIDYLLGMDNTELQKILNTNMKYEDVEKIDLLLKIPDEIWAKADQYIISENKTYSNTIIQDLDEEGINLLLSFSDDEWSNLEKRDLISNQNTGSNSIDIKYSAFLAKLSDKRFDLITAANSKVIEDENFRKILMLLPENESYDTTLFDMVNKSAKDDYAKKFVDLYSIGPEKIEKAFETGLMNLSNTMSINDIESILDLPDAAAEKITERNLASLFMELDKSKDSQFMVDKNYAKSITSYANLTDEEWNRIQDENLLYSGLSANEILLLLQVNPQSCDNYEGLKTSIRYFDQTEIDLLNSGTKWKDLPVITQYEKVKKKYGNILDDAMRGTFQPAIRTNDASMAVAKLMTKDEETKTLVTKLLDMVDKEKIDKKIIAFFNQNTELNDNVINDLKLVVEADNSRKNIGDLIVPRYRNSEDAMSQGKIGDVFEIEKNGSIYIKTNDNEYEQLGISKKTYLKLFPPVERYFYGQNIGDCGVINEFNTIMSNPKMRIHLLKAFNETDGKLQIKYPEGEMEHYIDLNGEFKDKVPEVVSGAAGYQLLEYVFGLESRNDRTKELLQENDYASQRLLLEERKTELANTIESLSNNTNNYDEIISEIDAIDKALQEYDSLMDSNNLNITQGFNDDKYVYWNDVITYVTGYKHASTDYRDGHVFRYEKIGVSLRDATEEELQEIINDPSSNLNYILDVDASPTSANLDYLLITGHAEMGKFAGLNESGEILISLQNPWNSALEITLPISEWTQLANLTYTFKIIE